MFLLTSKNHSYDFFNIFFLHLNWIDKIEEESELDMNPNERPWSNLSLNPALRWDNCSKHQRHSFNLHQLIYTCRVFSLILFSVQLSFFWVPSEMNSWKPVAKSTC